MLVRTSVVAGVLSVTTALLSFNSVSAQTNSQRDAVLGGVAGAIIGGVTGHQNDETTEGIAIGGVAGAIAGHVLGKSKDINIQQQYRYQQQAAQAARQQQAQRAAQLKKAVSIQDAIALSNSGVSPQLIINQIHSSGVAQEIGVSEIITLHQNGVSELVINEMQQASVGGPSPATIGTPQPAVVLEPSPPVIVARPRPTIVFEQHGNLYRSPRGYHSAHGSNIYHGNRRTANNRGPYGTYRR
jgi:outer membrane lipoprotein SlyB